MHSLGSSTYIIAQLSQFLKEPLRVLINPVGNISVLRTPGNTIKAGGVINEDKLAGPYVESNGDTMMRRQAEP